MTWMQKDKPEAATPPRESFLDERAFKSRTVLVFGEINDKLANSTVKQLIALSSESDAPINVLVSSPGGHVESGDTIHDVLRFIPAPVNMIGTGWVGSAACHVYLAAPRPRRVCLPNTRFLIHQPSGGMGGQASDIAIQAEQMAYTKKLLAERIAAHTGQTVEQIETDSERDRWFTATEARDYGIIDKVILRRGEMA